MSKQIPGNQKHMILEDRVKIETGLNAGKFLKDIALELGKDPTTIAKEIKKHRIQQPHSGFGEKNRRCAIMASCHRTNLCYSAAAHCHKECKRCNRCTSHCPDYVPFDYHCPKTDKAPFVCNACPKRSSCRLDKAYYRAATAQKEYRTLLVGSRVGLNISEADLALLDETVSPLIRQGQSPYMILQNHPEITICEKTLYNYIDGGALSVGNLDLPKKVVYKLRNVHKSEINDAGIFEGRTYKDYQEYIVMYPDTRVVEMDTVIGCEGSSKVLLTWHFTQADFMMAYLLDNKESACVEAKFDEVNDAIGTFVFSQSFQLILTDRGGEFQHPDKLECGTDNIIRTSIYYCDPMCSWQKPHCEKNHEYIRKILPKGTSFDDLTQEDIRLVMSHINSSPRESLGGHTPMELAMLTLPKELMEYFDLSVIAPDDIVLTPELLKK